MARSYFLLVHLTFRYKQLSISNEDGGTGGDEDDWTICTEFM